jgi:hypothetical protein
MTVLSMENPVFVTYMIAGAIMILKLMGQGWIVRSPVHPGYLASGQAAQAKNVPKT